MASYYPFGRMQYSDYVQGELYVRDITGAIKLSGDQVAKSVVRYGRANLIATALQTYVTLVSNEALSREIAGGVDMVLLGLDGVRSSIEELNSTFSYNMGLVVSQLQAQNRQILDVAERLDTIHKTLESPTLTQAREFYRAGCERLERGLLDKALESFHKSEEKNDTNYLTQLQLGRLYLYGKNDDGSVIDLEKAHKHLLLAAKYGKAELAFLPDAAASTGEAFLHAAIACYIMGSEAKLAGDSPSSDALLDESVRHAREAVKLRPSLGEAYYQAATGLTLLTRLDEAVVALEQAIAADRKYSLRALGDPNFETAKGAVIALLERLRSDAQKQAGELLARKREEIDSFVFVGEKGQTIRRALDERVGKAERLLARGTLFDYQDAIPELSGLTIEVPEWRELTVLKDYAFFSGTFVTFSSDGAQLASGGIRSVRVWDVLQRRDYATLGGYSNLITSGAFSPDGRLLVTNDVSTTKLVRLWDVRRRCELVTLAGHSNTVRSVAFSPDGELIASGSRDYTIKLWDVRKRHELTTFAGHSNAVNSVAFSPDGEIIASGSDDHTIKLWDVRKRRELATLSGCTGDVQSVAFSPDGTLIASGSKERTVKLWDVSKRRELATLPAVTGMHHEQYVAFSPDGALLATNAGPAVKLWDVYARHELTTLLGPEGLNAVVSVKYGQDGTAIATSADHAVKQWNIRDQREMDKYLDLTHRHNVISIAFSPTDGLIAVAGHDETVRLWGLVPEGIVRRSEWERLEARRREAEDARAGRERALSAAKLREERQGKSLCTSCGAKLGLGRRLAGHTTCNDCDAKRDA